MSNFNAAGKYIASKNVFIFNTSGEFKSKNEFVLAKPKNYTHYCQKHGLLNAEIITIQFHSRNVTPESYCMLCLKDWFDKYINKVTVVD